MTDGGKLRLLIATIAFSMGVDCPDICNVHVHSPPSSLVQYVQESGRVGQNLWPYCYMESLRSIYSQP